MRAYLCTQTAVQGSALLTLNLYDHEGVFGASPEDSIPPGALGVRAEEGWRKLDLGPIQIQIHTVWVRVQFTEVDQDTHTNVHTQAYTHHIFTNTSVRNLKKLCIHMSDR